MSLLGRLGLDARARRREADAAWVVFEASTAERVREQAGPEAAQRYLSFAPGDKDLRFELQSAYLDGLADGVTAALRHAESEPRLRAEPGPDPDEGDSGPRPWWLEGKPSELLRAAYAALVDVVDEAERGDAEVSSASWERQRRRHENARHVIARLREEITP